MQKDMCLISDYRGRKDQISRFPWFHLFVLCFPWPCSVKTAVGFCSQGWKFCSTCGSQISEEFNLRSTNPNGNGGQTRHTDKSDKPLCFADFDDDDDDDDDYGSA